MTRITAIFNKKGGVGKTHTSFHMAGAYSQLGDRVLVFDLDPQGNLSRLFLRNQPRPSATIYNVLIEDKPLSQAVVPTSFPGIHLVPSQPEFERLEALKGGEFGTELLLREALNTYLAAHPHDQVIFDCPPGSDLPTRNALAAAGHVIIPVEADLFSVEGLRQVAKVVAAARRTVNPRLLIDGLLISLFDGRRSIENLFEQQLRESGIPVFKTKIKDSTVYKESITAGKPITYFQPHSEQANAFRQLLGELRTMNQKTHVENQESKA